MQHQQEYRAYVSFYVQGTIGDSTLEAGSIADVLAAPAGTYAMGLGVFHSRSGVEPMTPEQFDVTIESMVMAPDATVESILQLASQAAGRRGEPVLADACNAALGVLVGPTIFTAKHGRRDASVLVEHYVEPVPGNPGGYMTTIIKNVVRIARPKQSPEN